jgi:dUTP pyrophosphatase
MLTLKVKRLSSDAKLPAYAHPGDAGLDLCAAEEVTVLPGERARIRTGIALEIPEGYVGLCWDKSGLSMNHGLKTMAGVIDAGYRGEVVVMVANLSLEPHTFSVGDKVMQVLIQRVERVDVIETDELADTARADAGFGSTGR